MLSCAHGRRGRAFRAFTVKAHFIVQSNSIVQSEAKRKGRKKRRKGKKGKKDGPGPVMVSDTLCPAVHIFSILKLKQGSGPEGDDVL